MPKTTLYARTGEAIGEVELSEELFSAPVNVAVLHQVVTAQMGPAMPARARAAHRNSPAAAWSSDRSPAHTCSGCPAR